MGLASAFAIWPRAELTLWNNSSLTCRTDEALVSTRAANSCWGGPVFAIARQIAVANASGLRGGTRKSEPSIAISGTPPTVVAMKGVPQACDSSNTLGTPSETLDNTVQSAA